MEFPSRNLYLYHGLSGKVTPRGLSPADTSGICAGWSPACGGIFLRYASSTVFLYMSRLSTIETVSATHTPLASVVTSSPPSLGRVLVLNMVWIRMLIRALIGVGILARVRESMDLIT